MRVFVLTSQDLTDRCADSPVLGVFRTLEEAADAAVVEHAELYGDCGVELDALREELLGFGAAAMNDGDHLFQISVHELD